MHYVIQNGSSVVSYNIIDFTMYDLIDCKVESHYHRTFASYQKYIVEDIVATDNFTITVDLTPHIYEANDPKYAEVTVSKVSEIKYSNLYGSSPLNGLLQGLDDVLNPYYIVEIDDNGNIIITSKTKGNVPNCETPMICITRMDGIDFKFSEMNRGTNTDIFVPTDKRDVIHIPITSQGESYVTPTVGDRLYIVDQCSYDRDITFTREVISVEPHAYCTCDVIRLDIDIDRIPVNHGRIGGIGITKPILNSNRYTANLDQTYLYKRKDNFHEILDNRGSATGSCWKYIGNYANMRERAPILVNDFIQRTENPHLGNSMKYYGSMFHWKEYEDILSPIYEELGEFLCDELFLLTSNKNRPDYLVHIDHHDKSTIPVVGSLTWPVLNCDSDSTTIWYDAVLDNEKIYGYGEPSRTILNDDINLTEIDRYQFSTEEWNSILLKHDDWHTIYNNKDSEKNRMLLQWRFKPGIPWHEICDLVDIVIKRK